MYQYIALLLYHFFCSYILETSRQAVIAMLEVNRGNWTLQRKLHIFLREALSFRASVDLKPPSLLYQSKYSAVKQLSF